MHYKRRLLSPRGTGERRLQVIMASSFPRSHLVVSLVLSLLLVLLPAGFSASKDGPLTYHGGPILQGEVNFALLWYGQWGKVQKSAISTFIKSLNTPGTSGAQPKVTSWWKTIESYQAAARKGNRPIKVKVAKTTTDASYSQGKVITEDVYIPALVKKATGGDPNLVAVIFTSRQVTVQGICTGACSLHGTIDKTAYIVVGNPETECPGFCDWPFAQPKNSKGVTLKPPSGDIGADATVINFATALAGAVTNFNNTGFYAGAPTKPTEAITACSGIFGGGASKDNPGKVNIDSKNGGAFNAEGVNNQKFLLPGVWNPNTKSCWTLL
ncbi:Protein EXORDIUM-like [Dillenia turbinata]|uniref:Protein EXORDIUM-like n=1 Tax=Dillenia turbinata TaxID=194707 RepID=A0AAN8ZFW4_9MAGN